MNILYIVCIKSEVVPIHVLVDVIIVITIIVIVGITDIAGGGGMIRVVGNADIIIVVTFDVFIVVVIVKIILVGSVVFIQTYKSCKWKFCFYCFCLKFLMGKPKLLIGLTVSGPIQLS